MKRSILGILLALALVMGLMAVTAMADETTTEPAGHVHCVCGGSAQGIGDHECADITWTPISGTVNFKDLGSGNYYLTDDVTVSAANALNPGDSTIELNICLNGKNISGTTAIFGYSYPGVTISICDCSGTQDADGNWTFGGTITGTDKARYSSVCGGVFYMTAGTTVNIYGGNLTGAGSTYAYGSVVYMSTEESTKAIEKGLAPAPTLNMYNGHLYYSATAPVTNYGGIIACPNTANINIYGGLIEGGQATGNGGNICVNQAKSNDVLSTITIAGGTITGGSGKDGGNIYAKPMLVMNGGTVSDGTATTNGGNIYNGWAMNLYGGTVSGGTAGKGGGNIMSSSQCSFKMTAGTVSGGSANYGGNLYGFQNANNITGGTVSGGYTSGAGGNICVESGSSFDATLTVSGNAVITGGSASNGGNISSVKGTKAVTVAIKGGTISGGTARTSNGGNIRSASTLNISGGTITGGVASTKGLSGGSVYCGGTLTMSGGTISGGIAGTTEGGNGGCVYAATFNMSAGTIAGGLESGYNARNGGCVAVFKAMSFTGGTISGGRAYNGGGNIYVASDVTVTINGGTLESGYASTQGGNVYVYGGTLDLVSGTLSKGQSPNGGNVLVYEGTMTMSGGSIENGRCTNNGANINVNPSATLTVTGGTISGGYSSGNTGGNIFVVGTADLRNATISDGEAWQGGNLYVNSTGVVTMTDVTVTGGVGRDSGGSIYTKGSLALDSCRISGGFTKRHGGNIYILADTEFTMTNTTVSGGSTRTDVAGGEYYGGNIFAQGALELTAGNTVSGGTANQGGNIYAVVLTMTGGTVENGTAKRGTTTTGDPNSNGYGGNLFLDSTTKTSQISGGTISGGYAENHGGSIFAKNLLISGGTISGGQSLRGGGNLNFPTASTITMTGGLIENGTAAYGGNVYSYGGDFTAEGGTVSGGISNTTGGNIYLERNGTDIPTFTLSGNAQILGGTSKGGNGGNVTTVNAVISGGTISGGNAFSDGGGICVEAQLTMTGGSITDNKSGKYGGNIWAMDATITGDETGSNITIARGEATSVGGNICIAATLTARNITVFDGVTSASGGNIWTKFVDMDNVVLKNGQAPNFGANLFVAEQRGAEGVGIINNCQLLDGIGGTSCRGGSLAVSESKLTVKNTVITDASTDASGWGRCVYIRENTDKSDCAELTLENVTLSNNSGKGTTIWNRGKLTLVGTLNIADNGTMDLMVDAQINKGACLDITDYTGTEPITYRRWEQDNKNDDAGLVAIGAKAEDAQKLVAWRSGYKTAYVEIDVETEEGTVTQGQLVLTGTPIQAMDANANTIGGFETVEAWLADETGTWYVLNKDFDGITLTRSMLVDLNGHNLTNLTLTEGVVLTGMDSTTDDYDCQNGYGTVTLTADSKGTIAQQIKTTTEQIGSVKRYLTVDENGTLSFHRFYLGITKMNLQPGTVGVGYKAVFYGDSAVLAQLDTQQAFGYTLYLDGGKPVTRFLSAPAVVSGKEVTLRLQNFDVENYSEAAIMGNVFLKLADGTVITSSDYSYTLRSLVETLDGMTANLTDAQMAALQTMCTTYEATTKDWAITNILAWAPEAEETK